MYREISALLLYGELGEDSILSRLGGIFRRWEAGDGDALELRREIHLQIKRLLDLATAYGFDGNLWLNYLTYVILTNENSFSLTCEGRGAMPGGTVNELARQDFDVFLRLMRYDFGPIEKDLGIDCFTLIQNYTAIPKRESMYNRNAGRLVREMSAKLAGARDADEAFELVTGFYRDHGVGDFAFSRAFRLGGSGDDLRLVPINNIENVSLGGIVGYAEQKRELIANTEAFIAGRGANNVLLYGDSGTGKSTSVKALINDYFDSGLRMIEIYKHQFRDLGGVIARIKNRSYRFIIFIDDLSFEEHEIEYKFLKAVIEGGVETRPENMLIYATSNRRHLIRESWKDRNDMEHSGDLHRSDTVEEKLSLAQRFGLAICYSTPGRAHYHEIVRALAAQQLNVEIDDAQLIAGANTWEIRHGGVSGRTAQQYISHLAGRPSDNTGTEE
ncbi:MAG: ATP-binding protein [Butyricicoccus sp.]|nr:ATP-binding protein [Butyricicoccus sp.]